MMRPTFANRANPSAFGHIEQQSLPSSFHHGRFNHVPAPQNSSPADLSPVVESLVVEYKLAEMVMLARLRAEANMANFFRQQQQQMQSPITTALPQQSSFRPGPPKGLELLSRASISLVSDEGSVSREQQSLNDKSETSSLDDSSSQEETSASRQRVYVDTIRDTDVLCGRGGRSNHHPGNKRYRHVISEMKLSYKKMETKSVKTDLSRAIVDHVCKYGGRFIKKEEATGRYYVLTRGEARKKTSQALRESKALKWTK